MIWEPGGVTADPELSDHFCAYKPYTDGPAPPTGGVVNPNERDIYRLAYVMNAQGDGKGEPYGTA